MNINKDYNIRKAKCYKLNNIISKTKFKNRRIDFLNIDTEKSEVDVLKSLNFSKYKPKLICVEIHLKKNKELKSHSTYLFLKRKISLILVTHNLNLAKKCDRVLKLFDGRIKV